MTPYERKKIKERASATRIQTLQDVNMLIQETERVREVAENAEYILDNLDEQFSQKTGLNKTDFVFLFLATALQILRWVLSPRIGESFDPNDRLKENDPSIKNKIKEDNKAYQQKHSDWGNGESPNKRFKDWQNIIFSKPPYDTMNGSAQFGLNLAGTNHRYKTLGHDPILGWIFGTVNIMTDTATMNSFRTFEIKNGAFFRETTLPHAFSDSIASAKEDWHRVPAAVFAEGVHLKSDEFTKLGLPIPGLSVFSEELASKLCSEHYDKLCLVRDLQTIGKQAAFAILINMIISAVHGLFYDKNEFPDMDLYAVKTHKILLYSNLIASTSNILYVAIATYLGDGRAWQKLDIGGILVTLYRLFTDVRFIYSIKEEFIMSHFDKLIQGDDDFMNSANFRQLLTKDCFKRNMEICK